MPLEARAAECDEVKGDEIMFGSVGVAVDGARGHCVVHTTRRGPTGPVPHTFRLHSIEEIDGALAAWSQKTGVTAKSMCAALRYAGQALMVQKGRRR